MISDVCGSDIHAFCAFICGVSVFVIDACSLSSHVLCCNTSRPLRTWSFPVSKSNLLSCSWCSLCSWRLCRCMWTALGRVRWCCLVSAAQYINVSWCATAFSPWTPKPLSLIFTHVCSRWWVENLFFPLLIIRYSRNILLIYNFFIRTYSYSTLHKTTQFSLKTIRQQAKTDSYTEKEK